MTTPTPQVAAHQGFSADSNDLESLRCAIDLAFDYRGDVTISRRSTPDSVEGYVFDRHQDSSTGEMFVRIVPADGSSRQEIPISDIARIEFTGRDAASGKSFETWVRKYVEKKLAGESASIESESLD